jgi:hypothetical protein
MANFTATFTNIIYTVRSEIRCELRLRYVDLIVNIEVDVKVCCCFTRKTEVIKIIVQQTVGRVSRDRYKGWRS